MGVVRSFHREQGVAGNIVGVARSLRGWDVGVVRSFHREQEVAGNNVGVECGIVTREGCC